MTIEESAKKQLRTSVIERLKRNKLVYVLKDGRATDVRPPPKSDTVGKTMTWAAWRIGKLRKNIKRLKDGRKMRGRMALTIEENQFEMSLLITLAPEFEVDLMGADQ